MNALRILIIEDDPNWQKSIKDDVLCLNSDAQIDLADTYQEAKRLIINIRYDLIFCDLNIPGESNSDKNDYYLGFRLLGEIRSSRLNLFCGLLVLTGFGTIELAVKATKIYKADDFIEKSKYDDRKLQLQARQAILNSRLRKAQQQHIERYTLKITFNNRGFRECQLIGANLLKSESLEVPKVVNFKKISHQTDLLNLVLLSLEPSEWRRKASVIGDQLSQALLAETPLIAIFNSGLTISQSSFDLLIQFDGPASGLGIPFELLRLEGKPLVIEHPMTRKLLGGKYSKLDSFHEFISNLYNQQSILRVLIIGANSDGNIPAAEEEARLLAFEIETDLKLLGMPAQIDCLINEKASLANVKDAILTGGHHLLHYAGHGRFSDKLPEISGLILHHGKGQYTLTASDLNLMLRDQPLRFAFLSCCMSARSIERVGRGDFHGTLHALAQADVPMALGYRWTVLDESALELARSFYKNLWRTLSPADALLDSRRWVAQGLAGRDDETWASPILYMQNAI